MTDSQALEKECPECKGDGVAERIGGYERPCDACHGEGFVQRPQPSGDEVERVARALWLKDREHDLKEAALAWDDPASMEHSDYWLERMPRNYARHRGMARAALAAWNQRPQPSGDEVERGLAGLLATFEKWLAEGPNAQPHYPGGMRPWSTGDLKYYSNILQAALAAMDREPIAVGETGEVTQADREAAWTYAGFHCLPDSQMRERWYSGYYDNLPEGAAIQAFARHRQSAADRVKALEEALRIFAIAAYPVASEINPRGYNWSESYLDEALAHYKALEGR